MIGLVEWVTTDTAVAYLTADVAAAATVLPVDDAAVLTGVTQLQLPDSTIVDVLSIDPDADTVTLTAGLADGWSEGDPLFVYPLSYTKWAGVNISPDDEAAEPVKCRVPVHSLAYQSLEDGIRALDERPQVNVVLSPEPMIVDGDPNHTDTSAQFNASTVPIVITDADGETARLDADGLTFTTDDPISRGTFIPPAVISAIDVNSTKAFVLMNGDVYSYDVDFSVAPTLGVVGSNSDVAANSTHVFVVDGSADINKYDATTFAAAGGAFPIAGTFSRLSADPSYIFAIDGSSDIAKYDAATGASVGSGFPIAGTFSDIATDGTSVFAVDGSGDIAKYAVSNGAAAGGAFPIAGTFTDVNVDGGFIYAVDLTGIRKFDSATGDEVVAGYPLSYGTFVDLAVNDTNIYGLVYGSGAVRLYNNTPGFASVRMGATDGSFSAHPVNASDVTVGGDIAVAGGLTVDGTASLPLLGVYSTRWIRTSNQSTSTGTAATITYGSTDGTALPNAYFSESSGTVTVAVAGVYDVSAEIDWAANADANRRLIRVNVNGSTYATIAEPAINSASIATQQRIQATVTLSAGDTVALVGLQNSGGNLNVTGASFRLTRRGSLVA